MPLWLVKATWIEDDVEATEQWEVNAGTAQDAVTAVAAHLRFHPHHIEASLAENQDPIGLAPGAFRRRPAK